MMVQYVDFEMGRTNQINAMTTQNNCSSMLEGAFNMIDQRYITAVCHITLKNIACRHLRIEINL